MSRKYLVLLYGLAIVLSLCGSVNRVCLAADSVAVADSATAITDSVASEHPLVYLMDIEGAIGVVTQIRIEDAIEKATDNHAQLLVIRMDTPGGFMSATWGICKAILNSAVPVCIYIAPEGSRAGSAGVYMTYAAHFAAMAPSTNIGAAHPVGSGGEKIDSVMNEKITNDAVAQLKAAAERRGRNIEWAEQAVRQSVSVTSREALELHVVDLIATDMDDLLAKLNGRPYEILAQKKSLSLAGALTERIKTTFMQRFLGVITDPNIVFILFSIGGLGIVLELYHPGAIFPGVVGAISLILAFFAASVLPINYAGVALIMLAIVLFIAEIKIHSAGLITAGGLICLFLGGLMLVDTVDPALQVSKSILVTVTLCVGVVAGLVIWLVVKAQKSKPFGGETGLVGKIAEVRQGGMVYVEGALWKADGADGLDRGTKVEIIGTDKLILKVKVKDS